MKYNPKFKKRHIKIMMSFFLFPVYTLPIILIDIFKNKKYAFVLLALFFALLSYIMVPFDTMDIVRHYDRFSKLQDISIFDYQINNSYFSLEYIIKIIQVLGLPKEVLPFIYIFFIYFLTFSILHIVFNNTDIKYNRILLIYFFIFFVSQLRFIGYSSGLRTGLANALMLYGIFYLFYMKHMDLKGWFFIILSPIIHSSLILVIPFILLSKVNFFFRLYKYLFYIAIVLIATGVGTEIILFLVKFMPQVIGNKEALVLDIYIHGKWGIGYWNEISGNAYIYEKFLKLLPLYITIVYLLIVKRKSELRGLVYLLFFIISFFIDFRTLIDRYGDFLIQLILVLLLLEYQGIKLTKFKKNFLNLLLVSFLIVNVAGLRVYRDILFPSWSKVLYLPGLGYLFSTPDEDEYIKSQ